MTTDPSPTVTHKSPVLGYLIYLIAAFLWGINGTISKVVLLEVGDATRVSELRTSAAFVVLFIVVLVTNRRGFRLKRSEIPTLIIYSLLGITITQWAYFVAISRMPVGIALLIEFTAPIFVVLWVRFGRGQAVRSTVWLGLVLALGGLALVAQVWEGFTLDTIGMLAALLATSSLVIYYLMGEKASKDRDSVSLIMWGFGISSLMWAIIQPWPSFPWEALTGTATLFEGSTNVSSMQAPMWLLASYMVIGGTVIPFVLVIMAIQHLGAAGASLIGMVEPLIAFMVAWVVLGESLNAIQIAGGVAMLVGVAVAEHARAPHTPDIAMQ